ncbi:uncharacterized protein [Onthophagus taurus]|uniref:uncharacterized protein n=1 Tax=Onthophagus taurus TaxID=166361 RepID=UPI000C2001D5|nr:uncharacterized protein LOC111425754 [Onthophagus taurus]
MTELIVSRGDTFPRSFLDTYRSSRTSEQFYSDLKESKSDELVLQGSEDIPISQEIHHGHSDNLLDSSIACSSSPSEGDFVEKPEVLLPRSHRRRPPTVYDRVDPEDSIRDIVTENDFYKFVLFKKHYDKYLHLSQEYEKTRNIAYYLEEKYDEVKTERDGLIQQKEELARRLESSESLVREKEDEVFVQLERIVFLEEQCDKLKAEVEMYLQQKSQIEKERDEALRLLKEQARESEFTRRKLERARQEVFQHMTKIKSEKEHLERENDQLKEALELERKGGLGKYLTQVSCRSHNKSAVEMPSNEKEAGREATLSSQFQKAMQHLATCKRRKCSVCAYTRAVFGNMSRNHPSNHQKYEKKLFSCLQTPFLEMKNMIKPPPSPIHGEGESLSEWFCQLSMAEQSECSSLSVPFAELAISYMDDTSDTTSNSLPAEGCDVVIRHMTTDSARGFSSDSGFSSDACGDCKSNVTTPKEKFSPKGTLDEAECAKLTRTKWTASFRKLINRIKK